MGKPRRAWGRCMGGAWHGAWRGVWYGMWFWIGEVGHVGLGAVLMVTVRRWPVGYHVFSLVLLGTWPVLLDQPAFENRKINAYFFLIFNAFSAVGTKMLKKQILTSIWIAQQFYCSS